MWNQTEEVDTYYDEKSAKYDEVFDTFYYRIYDAITWRYLEPYIPTDPKAAVLDAGGGTGRWAIRMAKKGCNVFLMDISKSMLNIAMEKAKKEKIQHKIIVKEGDITQTGYADETFDMILCEHVLFLFKNPDIVIRELRRVLKRNAPLIVTVHNRYVQALVSLPKQPDVDKLENVSSILLRKKYGSLDKNGKIRIFTWTPDEFRTMLETNGFDVERIVGKGITMPLKISDKLFMKKKYSEKLFAETLRSELMLCEKTDVVALAGHLQAVARKK
jgi:ubiquinone/menaquinone biosynthesis C-methylase UbiE